MTWHGCFGVRVFGVDKITTSGTNAAISGIGINIIEETVKTMELNGYYDAIIKWKHQARNLYLTGETLDPTLKVTLQDILNKGTAYDANNFILDSKHCHWGYILNLDTECFEIYQGDQKKLHKLGRFCNIILWEGYIPCALFLDIPLLILSDFDPYKFIVPDE